MKLASLLQYVSHHRDATLLGGAVLLLLAALLRPAVPMQRDVHTFLLVADITQSMNAQDMVIGGKKVTRMAYTRQLMRDAIAALPCNTRVGIALFSGVTVVPLFHPVEVCANFDPIQRSVQRMEWRQAWHGDSRLSFGMLSAATALKTLQEPARIVFFTDGEESPKLHAFNRADLSHWQGGDDWLLVGIGGNQPVPVLKFDENDKVLGYWSTSGNQLRPGITQVSKETSLKRDDAVATQDYERYLSKLDERYLQLLAREIRGHYVRGDSTPRVIAAMRTQKPAKRDVVHYRIDWLLAAIAGLMVLVPYVPVRKGAQRNSTRNRRNASASAMPGNSNT